MSCARLYFCRLLLYNKFIPFHNVACAKRLLLVLTELLRYLTCARVSTVT